MTLTYFLSFESWVSFLVQVMDLAGLVQKVLLASELALAVSGTPISQSMVTGREEEDSKQAQSLPGNKARSGLLSQHVYSTDVQ